MEVSIQGIRMAYSESRPSSDRAALPLVLVHGYPLTRRMWDPQVEGLADTARVLAMDLRGHGESTPAPGPYSMELFADDLNAFLDALGISEPIVLGGLSMGGYIVFAFYRKYPQRVRGLVLTATRAIADSEQAKAGRDTAMAGVQAHGMAPLMEAMPGKLLPEATIRQRPELVELVRGFIANVAVEGALGDLAAMKTRPDSTPTLAQIRVPTLVIHGDSDPLVPPAEAQAMGAAIPGAQMHLIPGAGHLPNLENPTLVNRLLRDFLTSLETNR
jgi:3-oxoadipate enol-lactonase